MCRVRARATLLMLGAAIACTRAATPGSIMDAAAQADAPVGLDLLLPVPEDNPLTHAKVELGRRLFFDATLSSDGTISCASCHRPTLAFADTLRVSSGVHGRRGARNTPTLLNAGYLRSFTWDGRSTALEEQVLRPIVHEDEMGAGMADVVRALERSRRYRRAFRSAFGSEPTASTVAQALASYLRSLLAGESAFDRFRAGDPTALSAQAYRGFTLFVGRAGCAHCHVGPLLSDQRFHNTGVAWRGGRIMDPGRAAVTGIAADSGAFRTPTLRNVAKTSPYMHDGSIATLEEVIAFYARGGVANPYRSSDMKSLLLDDEDRAALLAFLHALDSPTCYSGSTSSRTLSGRRVPSAPGTACHQ